jgi:hypothetical protein
MSLEMAHKVILPPQKNYIPQFLKQRDINSYYFLRNSTVLLSPPGQGEGRRSLLTVNIFRMQEVVTVNIFRMQKVVFLLLSTVLLSPPEPAQGRGGGHYLMVNIFRMQEVVFLL